MERESCGQRRVGAVARGAQPLRLPNQNPHTQTAPGAPGEDPGCFAGWGETCNDTRKAKLSFRSHSSVGDRDSIVVFWEDLNAILGPNGNPVPKKSVSSLQMAHASASAEGNTGRVPFIAAG